MTYTIITPKAVQKQLDALPDDIYDRIAVKIQQLAEDPRPDRVVKMKDFDNEYRIRIGDYRVRFQRRQTTSNSAPRIFARPLKGKVNLSVDLSANPSSPRQFLRA